MAHAQFIKRLHVYGLIVAALLLAMTGGALAQGADTVNITGVSVNCPDGTQIVNGVEVVANLRPGFTYTATVVGLDGFDPVLAVIDENGRVLCNNESAAAATYEADLPTTGAVARSRSSAQLPFSYQGRTFGDISLVVGGAGNTAGEFILIIEGMAVTSADGTGDGAGDPFTLSLTPNLIATGALIHTYMISITGALDPYLYVVGSDGLTVNIDGRVLGCDDAGSPGLCWQGGASLNGSFVSRSNNRRVPGGTRDALLSVDLAEVFGLTLADVLDSELFLNLRFSSYNQASSGDYVIVFHLATTSAGVQSVSTFPSPTVTAPPQPTDAPIEFGQTVTGTLRGDQAGDVWHFEAAAGDRVTITLIADDTNTLDPFLYLYTAAGFASDDPPLVQNDDAPSLGLNSRILGFTLPATGEYVIRAGCFSAARCEGGYSLTLEREEPLVAVDAPIEFGQTVTGTLGGDQAGDVWRFEGTAGDWVTITLIADDTNTLDPFLYLYTATGFASDDPPLAQNDDAPSLGLNSQIEAFQLPATGEYVIRASCFSTSRCAGGYSLTLERVDAPPVVAEPTATATATPTVELYNVVLNGYTGAVLDVIRTVREITGVALFEAREIATTPGALVAEGVTLERARQIEQALAEVGGIVEVVVFGAPVEPVITLTPTPLPTDEPPADEPEEALYNVVLVGFTGARIDVVRAVRQVTSLELSPAIDLVNALPDTPAVLAEGVTLAEAQDIERIMTDASAIVELVLVSGATPEDPGDPSDPTEPDPRGRFNVVLTGVTGERAPVIAALRSLLDIGLRDGLNLVESAPVAVLTNVDLETARRAADALTAAGATVEIAPVDTR